MNDHKQKPKLYLHVGVHRTGTSSIQRALKRNRQALATQGVLYPELPQERRHRHLFRRFSSWGPREKAECLKALASSLSPGVPVRVVVLSDEDFVRILWHSTKLLAFLNEHFDLQVLLYLRRQDLWLESWYNQNIKWPWVRSLSTATPAQFLAQADQFPWIDYQRLTDKLLQVVKREQLVLAVMSTHDVTDTKAHFFAALGIEDHVPLSAAKRQQNQSLSAAKLEAVRRVGLIDVPRKLRNKVLRFVRDYSLAGDSGSTAVFSEAQRQAIMARFKAGNEQICHDFFDAQDRFGLRGSQPRYQEAVADADIDALAAQITHIVHAGRTRYQTTWRQRLLGRFGRRP